MSKAKRPLVPLRTVANFCNCAASENRRETVRAFYQKYDELAKVEAAEYEARVKASRAAREETRRGAAAPLQ